MALKQFDCKVGEGINTDMRAVRKDYFLDHDHSCLRRPVGLGEGDHRRRSATSTTSKDDRHGDLEGDQGRRGRSPARMFPKLEGRQATRDFPEELIFLHAEEILDMYPDLPRKQRETAILQKYPAVFIIGIGWVLEGRLPARDARRRLRRLGHADDLEETASRCTASTATSWSGTRSPSAATS